MTKMNNKTILIVEDNETNRLLVGDIMRRRGYAVIEARDAETALTMAREKSPDLVFMDIRLPGMDGLEAARLLKKDDATAHIPVVALTALAFERDRRAALDAGCDGFITKPANFDELLRTAETFAGKPDA